MSVALQQLEMILLEAKERARKHGTRVRIAFLEVDNTGGMRGVYGPWTEALPPGIVSNEETTPWMSVADATMCPRCHETVVEFAMEPCANCKANLIYEMADAGALSRDGIVSLFRSISHKVSEP